MALKKNCITKAAEMMSSVSLNRCYDTFSRGKFVKK